MLAACLATACARPAVGFESPLERATPSLRQSYEPAPSGSSSSPPVPAWSTALEQHGRQRIHYAYDLAARGALLTAQNEFLKILDLVARTLDAESGSREHVTALAAGQVALKEAGDFLKSAPPGGVSIPVATIAASHQTRLLWTSDVGVTNPVVAMQLYYSDACRQLVIAAGGQRIAAEALFGLGRVTSVLRDHPQERRRESPSMHEQLMLVYYQAAWAVDSRHHRAANELGVQLARFNQWGPACHAFEYSVAQSPLPQNTRNLAVAYARIGEQELSQQAWRLHQSLLTQGGDAASSMGETANPVPAVQWVDLQTFAQSGSPVDWTSFSAGDRAANGGIGGVDSGHLSLPVDAGRKTSAGNTTPSPASYPSKAAKPLER
ncbi:MAG: hypothetical protein KF861_24760, partial [Planctomycetaceae bacterium]|nr:hypothetical protein [Planctomycetaceae bacterium]